MRQMLNLPADVRSHLQKQDNMSAYITRLVRTDMSEGNLEDKIRSIVNDMLRDKSVSINNSISEAIGNSVKSILNF